MSHTVIALFRDRIDAQQAVSVLKGKGFDERLIDISIADNDLADASMQAGKSFTGMPELDQSLSRNAGFTDRIGLFFSQLFDAHKALDSEPFTLAARMSDAIVTVHAADHVEARAAAESLDSCGAFDTWEEEEEEEEEEGHIADASRNFKPGVEKDPTEPSPFKSKIFERKISEDLRLEGKFNQRSKGPDLLPFLVLAFLAPAFIGCGPSNPDHRIGVSKGQNSVDSPVHPANKPAQTSVATPNEALHKAKVRPLK